MCVSLAPDLFEIGDETHVTLIMAATGVAVTRPPQMPAALVQSRH
jgi:ferredoxin